MTILQQLADDHAYFKETFSELDALASDPAEEETVLRASALIEKFRDRHRLHLHRESSVLFPSLLGYLDQEKNHLTRSAIFHHMQEEHMEVGRKVYILEQDLVSRPLNAGWLHSFRELAESFMNHMKIEDETIFPVAAQVMPPEQLTAMSGAKFFPAF